MHSRHLPDWSQRAQCSSGQADGAGRGEREARGHRQSDGHVQLKLAWDGRSKAGPHGSSLTHTRVVHWLRFVASVEAVLLHRAVAARAALAWRSRDGCMHAVGRWCRSRCINARAAVCSGSGTHSAQTRPESRRRCSQSTSLDHCKHGRAGGEQQLGKASAAMHASAGRASSSGATHSAHHFVHSPLSSW